MKLNIYPEICCDYCNEIVHNHIDCPVCGKYTATDTYADVYDTRGDDGYAVLECVSCHTMFRCKDANLYEGNWETISIDGN